MEEDDEEHCRPHQLSAKAADVRQFYVFYLPVHVNNYATIVQKYIKKLIIRNERYYFSCLNMRNTIMAVPIMIEIRVIVKLMPVDRFENLSSVLYNTSGVVHSAKRDTDQGILLPERSRKR